MYVQADFIFRRFEEMVREDPERAKSSPTRQSSNATWRGSPTSTGTCRSCIKGVTEAYEGVTTEAFETAVREFFASATHPTLGVPYTQTAYRPMVELIRLLEAHEFQVYICSGGGRDFVRAISEQVYGCPGTA